MKLTTVIGSVNDNPDYYMFIPKQIKFWKKMGCKFIALFVGTKIPNELVEFSENIILWNNNLDLNSAFVGQNLRIYYTALLNLPDDEAVMITDMDMLPMSPNYYFDGLDKYEKQHFVYYRHIDRNIKRNEIYICYNVAHPDTWGKLFNIKTKEDVINAINNTYQKSYNAIPGSEGWFIDQVVMYNSLHDYEHLIVLNRVPRRLEVHVCEKHITHKHNSFILMYDDAHFHRSYNRNKHLIKNVEKQLDEIYSC